MDMESGLQQRELQKAVIEQPNMTGIPTQMKLNFEQRSGMSFDDVRVHYNSDKPAQFHALAYTQGTQIYVGPGQERSLPHELGHVVQQKAGRVRPTRWVHGQPVNDQPELEREADRFPVQCMPAPALRGVIQMVYPTLPRQRGNNCGYHALARAIYALYKDRFDKSNNQFTEYNLETQLTSYAIEKDYSVIGEAFDPFILAEVGNEFCENPDFKARGILIKCSVLDISKGIPDDILADSKNGTSVILIPYFQDETTLGPAISNGEENAHWGVIEADKEKREGDQEQYTVKLYEGNFLGSAGFEGDTKEQLRATPDGSSKVISEEPLKDPSDVLLKDMIASNLSINTSFSWIKFFNDQVWDVICSHKKRIAKKSIKEDDPLYKVNEISYGQMQTVMQDIVSDQSTDSNHDLSEYSSKFDSNINWSEALEDPKFDWENYLSENDPIVSLIIFSANVVLQQTNSDKNAVVMDPDSEKRKPFDNYREIYDRVQAVMKKIADKSKINPFSDGSPPDHKQRVPLAGHAVIVQKCNLE